MKKLIPAVFFLILAQLLNGQTGPDWHKKVAPALLQMTSGGQSASFLILLSSQADVSAAKRLHSKDEKAGYVYNTLSEHASKTQQGLISFFTEHHISYESLFIVNAIKTQGNQSLIQTLAMRADVQRIMANPTVHFSEPVESTEVSVHNRANITWGIDTINADAVWDLGYKGQNVVVGGEDTGYDWRHPALIRQYRGYDLALDTADHNYNWHDAIHSISPLSHDSLNRCGLDVKEPCDDYGHGTHTMGTMIGYADNLAIGVAPEAKWCGCRNMERGNGSPFTYIECFEWFLAPTDLNNENPDPSKAPHVINNSWGCPESEGCDTSNWLLMEMAIQNLRLAGTVVVVSAGNEGSACSTVSTPPAIFEESFSVGATAENDTIAGFSSRGPVAVDSSFRTKPNVSAPGVRTLSAKPDSLYALSSGTSMAGPHVVGVVALMISANPELAGEVETIENIIEQTAIPKTTNQDCGNIPGSEVPNNTYGYGRIDALAAVNAAIALIPVSTGNEIKGPAVKVFPNPAHDQFMIDLDGFTGNVRVELVDVNGKSIWSRVSHVDEHIKMEVNLTDKVPGIYFYRILAGKVLMQGKVIKNL
jgi:subtilisin family serine protease